MINETDKDYFISEFLKTNPEFSKIVIDNGEIVAYFKDSMKSLLYL